MCHHDDVYTTVCSIFNTMKLIIMMHTQITNCTVMNDLSSYEELEHADTVANEK